MELTKYAHACAVIRLNCQSLVIDPGNFSADFINPKNVIGLIITHQHADHFDKEKITSLREINPKLEIFTTKDVAEQLGNPRHVTVVSPGSEFTIGPFNLEFLGGQHALIHGSLPTVQNVGVLINGQLYYPGDSYALPGKPVNTLLAPAGGPWLKIGEAIDFVISVAPQQLVIPTHDAVLSTQGKQLADNLLASATSKSGAKYQRLESGQSITL